jgi:hypothetical protein
LARSLRSGCMGKLDGKVAAVVFLASDDARYPLADRSA